MNKNDEIVVIFQGEITKIPNNNGVLYNIIRDTLFDKSDVANNNLTWEEAAAKVYIKPDKRKDGRVCEIKDEIKDKYYREFLINFIKKHQGYTSDAIYIFTIEELTTLALSYVKNSNDLSYKWVLSDEYSEYLNEISKDDKTLRMSRITLPDDKRFNIGSFITNPAIEPKVMEDVPELNKEEIMKKISDSPDLSSYSTKELFDELIKRGGVEAHWLNPESHYSLDIERPDSCHDTMHFNGRGPVWIIFNYD